MLKSARACGLVLGLLAILPLRPLAQETPENEIRIGVLAFRGWVATEPHWKPLERYLADALGQPTRLVPVTLISAGPLIDNGGVHFLVTNPGHFVTLARTRPMSVLATRKRHVSDGTLASDFGSAIITAADGPVHTLKHAADRRLAAVDPNAFGGFQIAWAAFREHGIDPVTDAAALDFVGFPMDRIIDDVLVGRTDIGIVRSGLIEELAAEGKLDPARLRVLNPNASYTYPDSLSTRLFPEWPFLALTGSPAAVRDRMALALLALQDDTLRQRYGLRDGWGAPQSYHAVEALLSDFTTRLDRGSTTARLLPPVSAIVALLLVLGALWHLRRRRGAVPATAPDRSPDTPAIPLTQREREILDLVRLGHSSKEIARSLGISPKTVEFHRANLLRKHEARSTVELITKAAPADTPS